MCSKDVEKELQAARRFCESVTEKWPAGRRNKIQWLTLESKTDVWKVITHSPSHVTPLNSSLKTRDATLIMSDWREKLLSLGREIFNVCQSLPDPERFPVIIWPERVSTVKTVWISPQADSHEAIARICSEVEDLWREESLVLHGFPLCLNFSVNVLYIFGHLFEKVGFVYPHKLCTTFLFYKYCPRDMNCWQVLQSVNRAIEVHDLEELYISPSSKFYASTFFESSLNMNFIFMREQVVDILSNIEAAKKSLEGSKIMYMMPAERSSVEDEMTTLQCTDLRCKIRSGERKGCSIFCKRLNHELELLLYYIQLQTNSEEEKSVWLSLSEVAGTTYIECLKGIVSRQSKSVSFQFKEEINFCLKQLLLCQQKLNQILRCSIRTRDKDFSDGSCLSLELGKTIRTTMKTYPWSDDLLEVKSLDFGRGLWLKFEDHVSHRVKILNLIICALNDTWKSECLELLGFPLLSEFNVSLVFLLGNLFEKVFFFHPNSKRSAIFFSNYLDQSENVKDYLENAMTSFNLYSVTSLVPLKFIHDGPFFEQVRNYNNICLQKQCLSILKNLSLWNDQETKIANLVESL